MLLGFNHLGAPKRIDAGKFREIRVMPRTKKGNSRKQNEDSKSGCGITPGAAEGDGKIAREKIPDHLPALRIRPVDAAVRANYQAVQIIDQAGIPRLSTRNCQV